MGYTIYRKTEKGGEVDWGSRPERTLAQIYARRIVEMYRPGGDLERQDDALVSVVVQEDRTEKVPWRWDASDDEVKMGDDVGRRD